MFAEILAAIAIVAVIYLLIQLGAAIDLIDETQAELEHLDEYVTELEAEISRLEAMVEEALSQD